MENSSKALLIAAAVLIVVLIVTISIKILSPVEGTKGQVEEVGGAMSGASQSAVGKFQSLMGITTGGEGDNKLITNYTAEQIEADEHLYAIGKTVPTYVVAKFNDDYTEVIITKNGEGSDGLIREFAIWSPTSPMRTYSDTLETAIIKEGVINTGDGGAGVGTFSNCVKLKSVTLPNSLKNIEQNAFNGCIRLTGITIPNNVMSISASAFEGCTSLTSITIPNNVVSILDAAFEGCTSLTSVTIKNGIREIYDNAFKNCTALTSITIENGITSIGPGVFNGCTGLRSIIIPDSVTSIGWHAFSNCTGLTSITVPSSVTSIGNYVFNNLAPGSTIYCQTQEVANLIVPGQHYTYENTTVVVDPSKF